MKTLNKYCYVAVILLFAISTKLNAQVYNNAYANINFGGSGVSISYYPSGSDGTSEGDVILYENVSTLSGNSIDCYVVVESISSSTSIREVDDISTGGSFSSNQERFFSPNVNFPNGTSSGPGGTVSFKFQFIGDGTFSFNTSTNTASGSNITLTNVRINAYDIDGNGNSYSNQSSEFGGFISSEMSATTNITATYSSTTGLTSFRSNTTSNTSYVMDDDNRVRVVYDSLSSFDIAISAGGGSYSFLEFGLGSNWTNDPQSNYSISGMVYNDNDGLTDSELDGTLVGEPDGNELYINLLNSGDSVLASDKVDANGTFVIAAVPSGTYSLVLSTSQHSKYSTGISSSLPSGWESVGEYFGIGTGSDGSVDGILSNVVVDSLALSNAKLAIEKAPEADDHNVTISNPVWNTIKILGHSGTPILSGNDDEDGALSTGSTILITSIPSLNRLTYNGTPVLTGDNGLTAPTSSNPFTILNYDSSKLGVLFIGMSTTSASFNYKVVDAAGVASEEASYNMGWSSPLPVKFLTVDAVLNPDNSVLISWTTAMEVNNRVFEVERRFENEENFITVAELEGAGTSNEINEYLHIDQITEWKSKTVHYRIKQLDYNGAHSYSEIKTVYNRDVQKIEVFPNPSVDHVTVSTDELGEVRLRIVDMGGAEVYAEQFIGSTQINTTEFNKGFYFLQLISTRDIQTKRLQIVH